MWMASPTEGGATPGHTPPGASCAHCCCTNWIATEISDIPAYPSVLLPATTTATAARSRRTEGIAQRLGNMLGHIHTSCRLGQPRAPSPAPGAVMDEQRVPRRIGDDGRLVIGGRVDHRQDGAELVN